MTRPGPRFGPDSDGFAELRALLAFHHVPEVPALTDEPATASSEPASPNGPVIAPGLDLTAALAELAVGDRALQQAESEPAGSEPSGSEPSGSEPGEVEPPGEPAPERAPLSAPVWQPEVLVDPVPEPTRAPRAGRVPKARKGGGEDAGLSLLDGSMLSAPEVLTAPPVQTPFEETAEGPDVMAIVARAQTGDAIAFGELYDRYVDLIYRYVYYRVGTQTLTEDLVSETFLRALRRISSFSWQGRDFAAWLVTIARNLIADHFKSGRYRLEIATADMLEADRAQDGPEGEVLDAMTNERLISAVKQLNSEQQECVVLRFLQGMSVTETALAMGKTEGAIKALQYRAVRSLARLLPRELVQ